MSPTIEHDHDARRLLCEELAVRTGRDVQIVGDEWSLPSWNGLLNSETPVMKTDRPLLLFKPGCKKDVLHACELASRHGFKVSPRGSGHHYGGCSLMAGSLLLDLSELAAVRVDPATRTARVGPCATARTLRAATAPHGLHFLVPHLSDVGLSGYILGGGDGWGVRQWGAAADNVIEFEAVVLEGAEAEEVTAAGPEAGASGAGAEASTAGVVAAAAARGALAAGAAGNGKAGGCRLVRVNSESDPELFWGLRGAGSFLCVVTEFVLALHPVPASLPLIAATYPLSQMQALGEFFQRFHASNPPTVEASMAIVGGGGNGDGNSTATETAVASAVQPVVILACHAFAEAGDPAVEAAYAQIRALLPETRISIQEGPVPYDEALSVLDPAWSWPGLCMYGHGCFVPVPALVPAAKPAAAAENAGAVPGSSGGGGGGGALAVLRDAAKAMTSRRSILLVCPSAPSSTSSAPPPQQQQQQPGSSHRGSSTCGGGSSSSGSCSIAGGGSALGFRDTLYVGIYAMWTRSEGGPAADGDADHAGWVRSAAAALSPHVAGLYLNEVMHDQPGNQQVRASFEPATYARLVALKQRVDPKALLRAL